MDILFAFIIIIVIAAVIILVGALICFFMVFYNPPRKVLGEEDFDLPPGKEYEPLYPKMIQWTKEARAAEYKKVCTVISRWAPVLFRSTKPGLGVV